MANITSGCFAAVSDTTLTGQIEAKAGDVLIATIAARSALTIPSDMTLLFTSDAIDANQTLSMCWKKIETDGTYSVTVGQASAGRLYLNLVAVSGISVVYSGDCYIQTTSTREIENPDNKKLLWGITCFAAGTNVYTCEPDDLQIISSGAGTRLANIYDDGSSSNINHAASSNVNGRNIFAVVEIISGEEPEPTNVPKYLIKSYTSDGYELLTVADGAFQTLDTTEINAQTFKTYGFDALPSSDLLVTLSKFDLLLWNSSTEELPALTAEITATPPAQIVVTDLIDISDYSISGVESITATATGSPLFALSFDGKQTWEAWTGTAWATLDSAVSGMTGDMMASIAVDQWAAKVAGLTGFHLKFILHDGDTVESIVVDFIN